MHASLWASLLEVLPSGHGWALLLVLDCCSIVLAGLGYATPVCHSCQLVITLQQWALH